MCDAPPPPQARAVFNHFSKHVSSHCGTFRQADVQGSSERRCYCVFLVPAHFLSDQHYPEFLWMFSSHFLTLCCCSLRDANYSLLSETLTSPPFT